MSLCLAQFGGSLAGCREVARCGGKERNGRGRSEGGSSAVPSKAAPGKSRTRRNRRKSSWGKRKLKSSCRCHRWSAATAGGRAEGLTECGAPTAPRSSRTRRGPSPLSVVVAARMVPGLSAARAASSSWLRTTRLRSWSASRPAGTAATPRLTGATAATPSAAVGASAARGSRCVAWKGCRFEPPYRRGADRWHRRTGVGGSAPAPRCGSAGRAEGGRR